MTLSPLSGVAAGIADDRLAGVVERLDDMLAGDPDLSFQVAAYHDGDLVLDAVGGPHLDADSVMVPFSVTKNTIGLTVGLLIERGLLDLDAPLRSTGRSSPRKDKQAITVRQLLSHQAGLPQATPSLTWAELLDDHAAAERLAQSRPFWQPGSAFGYHAVTIGNLASELVFRVTGRTLNEFYEQELRHPLDVDFFLGLPREHEAPPCSGPADDPSRVRRVDDLQLRAGPRGVDDGGPARRLRQRPGQLAFRPSGRLGHRQRPAGSPACSRPPSPGSTVRHRC